MCPPQTPRVPRNGVLQKGIYEAHHGWKRGHFSGGTGFSPVEISRFFFRDSTEFSPSDRGFQQPDIPWIRVSDRERDICGTSGVNDSSYSGLDVLEKPFFRGSSDSWSCFAGNVTISYPTKNVIKKESLSIVWSNNSGDWKSKIYLCSKPPKQGPDSKRKGH